jgi:hypothetical protein
MDKASELVILSGEAHRHIREIAPDITEEEHKMIRDLLDCILKFPIVKNNHENTTREKAAAD